jgi:anion-transporting  ArsA/GET3 family ATPase
VLRTGKATEATRRQAGGREVYDAVVMDAPPTGRIARFLNVSVEVSGLAKVGPVRAHADSVARVIRSPLTAVHFVTTLEEMPIQETLDGLAEMRGLGIQVGGIFINKVHPDGLAEAHLRAAAEGRTDEAEIALGLKAAGLADAQTLAAGLAIELAEHARNVALQERERRELAAAGQPRYELPAITDGIDLGGLYKLAEVLRDQGAA